MGLDEIIDRIDDDTEAAVKRVMEDAKAEASKITEGGKAKAKQHIDQMKERAEMESKQMIARETSKARVEATQIYQQQLNRSVSDAIASIRADLPTYLSTPSYAKLLSKLAEMCESELGPDSTVYLQKEDINKLKQHGKLMVAESKEKFAGGLKGVSKEETLYVDYTLEKLLANMSDKIAFEILEFMK
jgi:vacuolar-type H+-ATPase subunit E/Vma4